MCQSHADGGIKLRADGCTRLQGTAHTSIIPVLQESVDNIVVAHCVSFASMVLSRFEAFLEVASFHPAFKNTAGTGKKPGCGCPSNFFGKKGKLSMLPVMHETLVCCMAPDACCETNLKRYSGASHHSESVQYLGVDIAGGMHPAVIWHPGNLTSVSQEQAVSLGNSLTSSKSVMVPHLWT